MPKNLFDQFTQNIPLSEAISERYLQYALSTIMHRALPDARDGLKPVQRRILYAMLELKLSSTSGFRKSAKISGDVMGNYHPHGEQAIYDALARMAQDFNLRYPLIDGQGNFGNIDGDKPASSRYTEARLTTFAENLVEGLNEDSVDFRPNYDDTLEEPILLPASFPNLLANGSTGIAVGMAANIPPHNIIELCNTCIHLIRYPDPPISTRMSKLPGPDFPTGGIIVSTRDQIEKAYLAGKGQIRVRARWEIENLGRNQWQIVVTEIPYQVQKSKLIESLAKLVQNKKTQLLADVRDESTETIRIVLEPKTRKIEPETLMEAIFKLTEMESRFSMNLNVLIDGLRPKVCDPWEILRSFLDHRLVILQRRSQFRIKKIDNRLTLLEGYLVAFLNLDRVIAIIRYEDNPKGQLIKEFELLDVQAEAILNMRLRSLRKLEEIELKNEQTRLINERAELDDLLNSEELQKQKITAELKEIKGIFAKNPVCKRRTGFADLSATTDFDLEDVIEGEPVTVICSKLGWIRLFRGHLPFDQDFKFRDGDELQFALHGQSTDKLIIFGSNGRFYSLPASAVPGGRGLGEPLRLMIELPNEIEIQALLIYNPERKLVVASEKGNGFIVDEADVLALTKTGKQVLHLKKGDQGKCCVPAEGDHLAIVGENRKMLVISLADIPVQTKGTGVRLQNFQRSRLSDLKSFTLEEGLFWKGPKGQPRQAKDVEKWLGKRAGKGLKAPYGFPKTNIFS